MTGYLEVRTWGRTHKLKIIYYPTKSNGWQTIHACVLSLEFDFFSKYVFKWLQNNSFIIQLIYSDEIRKRPELQKKACRIFVITCAYNEILIYRVAIVTFSDASVKTEEWIH